MHTRHPESRLAAHKITVGGTESRFRLQFEPAIVPLSEERLQDLRCSGTDGGHHVDEVRILWHLVLGSFKDTQGLGPIIGFRGLRVQGPSKIAGHSVPTPKKHTTLDEEEN